MKTNARIVMIGALLSAKAFAAPFLALGDNAELFLTGSVAVRFDDNIYLDSSGEREDTIFSAKPGFDLVFGRNAATSGNFYFNEEFLRYQDNSNQDTSLSSVGVNSRYTNGKTKVDAGASYIQSVQNDNDIRATGALVRRELTNLRGLVEVGMTEKTTLGVGFRFDQTDYAPTSYSDSDIWSLPLDVYYDYSEKLALSGGYQYRNTDLSGTGLGSKDHFLNIGARGEFTPKLTGQIRVGYISRDFDNGFDDTDLGLDANLVYNFSEKTLYRLNLANDFGSSATGQSTQNLTVAVSANSKITEQWAWNANLALRSIDYPTRSDDFFEGGVGLAYTYSNMVNFVANFTHRSNDSSSSNAALANASEFTNSVFSLGANIRY